MEQQCQQDQELQFFDLHPSNVSSDGRPIFNQLKYSKGVIVRTGDKVKLPLKDSLDDPHFTDVEITGFTADRVLPADKVRFIHLLTDFCLIYDCRLHVSVQERFYFVDYLPSCMDQKEADLSPQKFYTSVALSR